MSQPVPLVCAAWTLFLATMLALPAVAQTTSNLFREPTFAELMGDQMRQLGSHLDTRNQLAAERARNIADYTQQLAACGNCAKRAELQSNLDYWKQADAMINRAEHAALSSMGLGRYANLGELQLGLAQELSVASEQIMAQRQRQEELGQIIRMVQHECELKHAVQTKPGCPKRPLKGEAAREHGRTMQACRAENDPVRMYANDLVIRETCAKLPNAQQCVDQNSIVGKARSYNVTARQAEWRAMQTERAQEKEDFARAKEEAAAKYAQKKQDREDERKMTAEERRARQLQRKQAFYDEVNERTRARRECEAG
jgi:hypothetical protein